MPSANLQANIGAQRTDALRHHITEEEGEDMKLANTTRFLLCLNMMAIASGCASWNSGSIVSVMNDQEVEVIVGKDFVKAGDTVNFYRTECNTPKPARYRKCSAAKIGEGKVVSREGDRAVVRSNTPIKLTTNNYVSWAYPQE
jgi:hypothetical protein